MRKIAFLLVLPFYAVAQGDEIEYTFNGFADTYHAVRSQSPYDFMSSRSRLRTEFGATKGKSYLFASVNSVYNGILEEETRIELREVFFKYSGSNWDFKAGRQIIIWGVADGLRITDVVSPMDMTEFLARDYDDIRIPVDAFRVKYLKSNLSAEFVFVPVPSFFIIPDAPDNPWSVFPQSSDPHFEVNMENTPLKKISNSEFGGRFSFFLSGIDFSFSALHTWNKMPVFQRSYSTNNDTVFVEAQHNRMDMVGMDFSFPIRQFVVRGEVAEYFGELQTTTSGNNKVKRNTSNFLLGVDWYPGNDWTLTFQYSHKLIPDYIDKIETKENTVLATSGITKKVFQNTLSLSTFTYFDVTNQSFFNRTSADYSLTDEIHMMAGYDWFEGDEGMFGLYKNNSEYWVKAKFSF
ncbi:MAG: hypothetical protein MI975_04730 [Cytophagales bacterium]|nr:hypothetical protein [Cytophagales bacterium]